MVSSTSSASRMPGGPTTRNAVRHPHAWVSAPPRDRADQGAQRNPERIDGQRARPPLGGKDVGDERMRCRIAARLPPPHPDAEEQEPRSEEPPSELQPLMRLSYAFFCLQ